MKLLAKIGLFGLLAGGTASALYADPVGGWLSPNGVSGAGAVPGSSSTMTATGHANISLADMQVRVGLLHEQMRADARHVQHLQAIAHKEKDVIKLNCVNDKLVQIKPQMNMADSAEGELEAGNEATRFAVFESLTQSAENIRRLREEADQCIGEPIQTGGESSNSFTGPRMPDDPTRGLGNVGPIEAPGYASPFN